ncbi:hypothetical protein IJ579_04605 [bacterium]|nr:hypothetical protein [bacterium]
MLEGMYVENIMMHSETRAYPQYPTISAGVMPGTQSLYRYSLRESSYPTLSIVDKITDGQGNYIQPGHYELAISDEKDFLILIQGKQPVAIMPVFKLEIETSEKSQIMDSKALKRKKKQDKEIAKTNKKRARSGMPPVNEEEEIFQEATMEYNSDGNYYLIKYERGDVKAWSAIKTD